MQAALIVRWSRPNPGLERKTLEYGVDTAEFWGRQAAAGRCSTPEMFFTLSEAIWMVKGDEAALRDIMDTDEAKYLVMRANLLMADLHLDLFTASDGTDAFLGRYAKCVEEFV